MLETFLRKEYRRFYLYRKVFFDNKRAGANNVHYKKFQSLEFKNNDLFHEPEHIVPNYLSYNP